MSNDLDLAIRLSADTANLKKGMAVASKEVKGFEKNLDGSKRSLDAFALSSKKLDFRPFADVNKEILGLERSFKLLKKSGKLSVDELAKAEENLKKKTKELRKETTLATKELSSMTKTGNGLTGLFGRVFAIGTIIQAGKSLFNVNVEMEALRSQLISVTGATESANRAFSFVQDFATRTPFQVEGLTSSYIRLKNFGIEPTTQTMLALTNQASKLGGSQAVLDTIIRQLGQAYSKQKLQMEDIVVLAERGVPIFQLLADVTGRNTSELFKMSEKGELTVDVLDKLIVRMGELASGSNEQAMQTIRGSVSNLGDSWTQLLDSILGSGSEGAIGSFINSMSSEVQILDSIIGDSQKSQITHLQNRIKTFKEFGVVAKGLNALVQTQTLGFGGFDLAAAEKNLESLKAVRTEREASALAIQKENDLLKAKARQQAVIAKAEKEFAVSRIKFSNDAIKALNSEIAISVKAYEKFTNRINELSSERASEEERTADQLREINRRNLTESEQQADIQQQIDDTQLLAQQKLAEGDEKEAVRLANKSRTLADQINDETKLVEFIKTSSAIVLQAKDSEIERTKVLRTQESTRQNEMRADLKRTQDELKRLEAALAGNTKEATSLKNVINSLSDPIEITINSNFDQILQDAQNVANTLNNLENKNAELKLDIAKTAAAAPASTSKTTESESKFAHGGSFLVGGSGGTDSQNVSFKASPDELVTIETPEQQRAGRAVSNVFNITMNGIQDVRGFAKQLQEFTRTNELAINVGEAGVIAG